MSAAAVENPAEEPAQAGEDQAAGVDQAVGEPGAGEEPDPVTLTDEQREAVARRREALALAAAAGSGKTSVLVERFVAAVLQDGLAPSQILAITFTDRAAGELRERVRARFLELGERAAARDTEAAFVSTFHGFCARLLGAHPLAGGVSPGFAVLDEGIAAGLRERAFAMALREFVHGERADAVELVAAYGPERLRTMVEGAHARQRSRGQRLPRLPRAVPRPDALDAQLEAQAISACVLLDELLRGFSSAYERLKRERDALDFDDLELLAGELLAGEEGVRAEWSRRFELVMVDEFQDTNRRQLEILGALERDNLFTVGDEFQAIYGFRHAEVALFRERDQQLGPEGKSLALTFNFRSRGALVGVVGEVFEERLEGFSRAQAARAEEAPSAEPAVELLLTAKTGWEQEGRFAQELGAGLPAAATWRHAEARLLAGRVAELTQAGLARAGEVVVLLRALGDLAVYERALQQRGLATVASAGAFWENLEVEDLLAYLRALANPLDELALYGALASPLAGVSRDGLAVLALASREGARGAFELASTGAAELGLAPADERALEGFCAHLARERARAPLRAVSELLARALERDERDHGRFLRAHGSRGIANAYKLLRIARRFEAAEGRDLRGFLDHAATLKARGRVGEADAPVLEGGADAVRLMSIHAAKGLEFPVVCVADLGRAPYTRSPDLLVDGERIGLQLVRLDGASGVPTLDYVQLCEERRAEEAAEEDRILYVAMTRARERLLLSGAIDLDRGPSEGPNGSVMSWLAPALLGDLAELQRAAQDAHGHPFVRETRDGAASIRCRLAGPADTAALTSVPPAQSATAPGEPAAFGPGSGEAATPGVASPQAAAPGPASLQAASPPSAPPGPDSPLDAPAASVRARRGANRPPDVHPQQLTLEPALPAPGALRAPGAPKIETLSYSSLRELERCGYRYYLERVLRLAEEHVGGRGDEGAGSRQARARGTLVHSLLETFDFTRPEEAATERLAERIEGLARELGLRLRERDRDELAGMVQGAALAAPAQRIAAARRVRREHPFAFPAGEGQPLVYGVIDLLAEERDGVFLVVDYKSDPVAASDDLAALVEREYALQRELYALAVLRGGAGAVEVVHWFLRRPQEPVAVRFTAGQRESLQAALEARVGRALGAGFSVSTRPHRGLCLTCPGRERLCSWPESETMRDEAPPGGDPD